MNHDCRIPLPRSLGWMVGIAGLLAVFATYWDEAWHTDVGRDTAWSAPHLLLYGSVGVVGVAVAAWGLQVLLAVRSLRATLAHLPLLAASLGAVGALAAAPIDAAWHTAYGRDSVLFSPPHMLVVLASTGLVLGVLAGLPRDAAALRATVGVLLLANAVAVVFEYEADVPQFTEVLYLPLLLMTGLLTAWILADAVPIRLPATTVVAGYAVLRLMIAAGLGALGRSTPDLPLAVLGLAAFDLPLRRTRYRVAAALAATSALALSASASGLASPVAADVAVGAVPLIAASILGLLIGSRRGLMAAPLVVLGAVTVSTMLPIERASAHDPGQGETVATSRMTAQADRGGNVVLTITVEEHCDDLEPGPVVARRAGDAISAPLTSVGECTFRGRLALPDDGRWFVYAEFAHAGQTVEAWLPVEIGTPGRVEAAREIYVPAGEGVGVNPAQIVFGGLIYALGVALVTVGIHATRASRRLAVLPSDSN